MTDEIRVATTASDYKVFGGLIREYWAWLQVRYTELPGLIDAVGAHQALDAELSSLPNKYGPPEGKTLLAVRDGQVCGAVAYRDMHDGSCEMKRLYVPDRYQGHGTGRRLCEALLKTATDDGYPLMRLDTGTENTEALQLYASLGFRDCPTYHDYPAELRMHIRFMEKPLAKDVKR